MTKGEIRVGGTYLATVGRRSVEVRVERAHAKGGWDARAVATGKPVRLKDARHLRPAEAPVGDRDAGGDADPAEATIVPQAAPVAAPGGDDAVSPADQPRQGAKRPAKRKAAAAEPAAAKAPKPMSALDAAAAVLKATGEPMRCQAMVDAMRAQGLWETDAPTPAATLSSAILRETTRKGGASRFRKTSPGHFAFNGGGAVK